MTNEKEAEDFKREMKENFEVTSSPPIRLSIAESKVIESAENSKNYIIKDDKPPLIFGWETARHALNFPGLDYKLLVNYMKNRYLSPNNPGIFFTFFKDNNGFRETTKLDGRSILFKWNLDLGHKNWQEILKEFDKKLSDWINNNNSKPELRNPIGLPNIGNTCYMNSLIQAFSVTPEISQILNFKNSSIFKPLANIITALKNREINFNYKQNLKKFQKKIIEKFHMFTAHAQHDSKELYNVLIDELVSNFGISQEKFTIITNKKFDCIGGNHDPVFKKESQLFLIIPDNFLKNIDEYLKKGYDFCGENQLWCENCNEMRDMMLKVENVKYPLNLAIYLPENRVSEWGFETSYKARK